MARTNRRSRHSPGPPAISRQRPRHLRMQWDYFGASDHQRQRL